MKRTGIAIKGYKFANGKLAKASAHKDVSARLRERGSKKVKVKRRTASA